LTPLKKSNANPEISILMPAYNAALYIKDAIESILNQNFKNYNLIILNDGSTDQTEQIIGEFKDPRIIYLKNENNMGLSFSRNKLIKSANGKYIAWMDADDISHPDRLTKEYKYLEKHPHVALVSSWVQIIDSNGKPTGKSIRSFIPSDYLSPLFLFVNYVAQSSVLIRKSILDTFSYNDNFPPVEDYQLWTQIAYKHSLHILPEFLVWYRVHANNMSSQQRDRAKNGILLNYKEQLHHLGITPTEKQLEFHYQIAFSPESLQKEDELKEVATWFQILETANKISNIYTLKSLEYILKDRWIKVCFSGTLNLSKWERIKIYFQSKWKKLSFKNLFLTLKFILQK